MDRSVGGSVVMVIVGENVVVVGVVVMYVIVKCVK